MLTSKLLYFLYDAHCESTSSLVYGFFCFFLFNYFLSRLGQSTQVYIMAGRQLQPNAKQVLIFGDQTESTLPHIREIYRKSPASLYLQQFLRGSSDAVRRCIYDLSAAKRGRFYFDSFLSLAESSDQQQCSDPVVQTILLCIAQLGTLVM